MKQPTKTHLTNTSARDEILWASADDQIRVRRRIHSAGRWPQHGYPVITLDVLPKDGTRVRRIGVTGRIDILLEHAAAVALLIALNSADPSVKYGVPPTVPAKPADRKARYAALNSARWERIRRYRR